MKSALISKITKTAIFATAATVLIVSQPSLSFAGGDNSGGGDSAEVEFASIGQGIATALRERNVVLDFDLNAYQQAISTAQVNMVRHALYQNNTERDALNYPSEKRIEVNRNHWVDLRPVVKVQLAFHEYLGIAGIERDIYSVSRTLVTVLGVDELAKITASLAPILNYHCTIKRTNAEHAVVQEVCGEVDMSTASFADTDRRAAYFHECDQISLSIYKMSLFGAGIQVQLSQLKKGSAESWKKRNPKIWSSFALDLYSAPNSFQISLGIPKGHLFKRHTEQYWASCNKN
ncbi:MAG TPA: hypothetical protein DCS07_00975 [Bdellovibrionales bacterium]|nr:MAG: hypothetical protein A2Z97_10820 [Bdellovibrionales bacterium GWB1_52_6]OFZ03548.1 MAG: hypothetical protein A2X97_06270 [Bdellovibrionales bacterium GWA1_52_35]OFZ38323.1 MAG: hypothetical protein A2070_14975 [Bdellovibrionales bacterium GWC1_52_8]HAR41200.1 hypothetical protein [Bdellovibrionales bacterium]HCM41134.1 hypothetical protein [Bdellovibrionales bacterium]